MSVLGPYDVYTRTVSDQSRGDHQPDALYAGCLLAKSARSSIKRKSEDEETHGATTSDHRDNAAEVKYIPC